MRDLYGDHNGEEELAHPVGPEADVDSEQPAVPVPGGTAYPESPLHGGPEDMVNEGGPVYHDPTQPVEPVYPQPHEVEEVHSQDDDESFLDKVKRWVTGDSD